MRRGASGEHEIGVLPGELETRKRVLRMWQLGIDERTVFQITAVHENLTMQISSHPFHTRPIVTFKIFITAAENDG